MSGVALTGWILGSVQRLVWVSLFVCSSSTWAAETPLAMIQRTVEQARGVLEDPAYQGPENFDKRIKKLETILFPRVDRSGFAQRCLAVHWKEINAQQRQRFVDLFTELLELSYGGMLDRYPAGVEFIFDKEEIQADYAQVDTRVFNPQYSEPFVVQYRLHRIDGRWLIYDVVAENVSMVQNYRTQFNRIINKSGYDGLVQALERKLAELRKAPPTT